MSNKTTIPVTIAIVSAFAFLLTIGIIVSNYSIPDTEENFEVIDVSTYYQSNSLMVRSSDGYIIKYLDNGEICTLKIRSDELTVRQTDNESYLIRTYIQHGPPYSRYEYELYLNKFHGVD